MSEPVEPSRLQRLFAKALTRNDVEQVHQIVLREVDAYAEDRVPCVVLIPIGGVIGVAIVKEGEWPRDEDIVFVSASAFGNALPALGFTVSGPVSYIHPPTKDPVVGPVINDATLREMVRHELALIDARRREAVARTRRKATEEDSDVEG